VNYAVVFFVDFLVLFVIAGSVYGDFAMWNWDKFVALLIVSIPVVDSALYWSKGRK
jgi:hypothetical protein